METQSQQQSQLDFITYKVVQFYKNSLYKTILTGHECASAIIDILVYPYAWTFLLLGNLSQMVWGITESIIIKTYALLSVIPLAFKVCFWNLECGLTYWCNVKDLDTTCKTISDKIYPDLETILNTLGLLPFSEEECLGCEYFLEMYQNVIFGQGRLPVPDFITYHPPTENGIPTKPSAKDSEKNVLPPSDTNTNSSKNILEKTESTPAE